jgi:V/A-type H+-transporting ATPase subunit F
VTFYCIADEDTVRGFRLAGIRGQPVSTAREAEAAVNEAADRGECGVIILTQGVAAGIRELVESFRLERDRPLILEIPGPEGPLADRRSLRQVVEEAVGLRID